MPSAERAVKHVCDSCTEHSQLVMPLHLNGYGNLFGGQLAKWIDILAGVVARRHCGMQVATAAIENLRFQGPATQNDLIVLQGRMTYAGTTSMEIRVDSHVEDENGVRRTINTAFVIMVALDKNGKPHPVPALVPETPEEVREFEAGARRREMRRTVFSEMYS